MTKGLVKSSKKGQILYEKILKNRNPEKKRNYEQYKTFRIFEKEISAKLLFRSYWNIISNKRGMLWKKLLDTKNAPLFISVKNRKIVDKKEIAKRLLIILLMASSIPESKTTSQKYDYYDGPCLSTINHMDIELENVFARLKTSKS